MNQGARILLIAGIFLVDMMIFMLPLSAFFAACIIWVRPPWFKEWVQELYESI